jgi:soluble lytic murein transglycosylase
LMQIIPPTGEMIARKLKVPDFDPEDLFETEKNITFGAWYLHNLMKRSEGDLVRLFSSYNAGERRSKEWWKRFKHLDVDERIESITFRETRGYVKKVLRNLENYKRLYEKKKFEVQSD